MNDHQRSILLIQPPFHRLFKITYSMDRYPLSLGYLAGVIRSNTDWQVKTYNADFSPINEDRRVSYVTQEGFDQYLHNLKNISAPIWQEVRSVIQHYKPQVLGITSSSQSIGSAYIVAAIAKELNKECIVIIGGPHCSMVGTDVLKNPHIDLGVKGEGEETIIEVLHAIECQRPLSDIKGILYRENGRLVETMARDLISNLDVLPFPHKDAEDILHNYKQYPPNAFRGVFAARGCPYQCMFCGSHKIWGRKVRFRKPANVVQEIIGLQKRGLKFVAFEDDTFGIHKPYITELCDALKKHGRGIKWGCELHVSLVNDEIVSLMKSAGCYSVSLGIESGNNDILKAIRKNITIEDAFEASTIIKKHGLILHTFFMVGFPQETEETLRDTLRAIKTIHSDTIVYSIFTPYPGTELFSLCQEKGLIPEPYDPSLYFHQSPLNCFCSNINPDRFRALIADIEREIDQRNAQNKIRQIFSFTTIAKIREWGIKRSLRKAKNIIWRI